MTELPVLVIDDSETARQQMRILLKGIGYSNIKFAIDSRSSRDSLNAIAKAGQPLGLVICDWNMPDGDGIEVLKWVRSHDVRAIRRVPFLKVTGKDDKIRLAMDEGANNYVAKPLSAKELAKKIQFCLS